MEEQTQKTTRDLYPCSRICSHSFATSWMVVLHENVTSARNWRGAGYGHRSIGDDWIVDHLVEYLFRDAICVHIVDILGYFLALVTNALATGHREERTQRHARESLF